ncbi:MAG: Serine/threonine-protein kinase PknB [Verrucomicrobiota bacterium]
MSNSPQDEIPPQSVGPYLIEGELGRGAMGVVYAGRHKQLQMPVAVKLFAAKAEHAGSAQRFVNEARTAARIESVHLVRIFECGLVGEQPWYAMELTDSSLGERIKALKGAPLPEEEVLQIATGVARALVAAVKAGAVHRDIKPDNIMMARDGLWKLADLGLARPAAGLYEGHITAAGSGLGTPAYLAPEQALDARSADSRSDIYGLGCTLFHAATGRLPFTSIDTSMLLRQHAVLPPDDPRKFNLKLSQGTASLILRCMEKDPSRRFQTPAELEAAAYALLKPMIGRPVHQNTVSSIQVPPTLSGSFKADEAPPRRARPVGLILVASLLLLIAILLILMIGTNGKS